MKHLIVILFIGVSFLAQAQAVSIGGHSLPELRQAFPLSLPRLSLNQSLKYLQFHTTGQAALPLAEIMLSSPKQIPQAWSYQDLAFFCKLEVKLEKATRMPIKFRLGEVQYAENREGKYGSLQQQLGN